MTFCGLLFSITYRADKVPEVLLLTESFLLQKQSFVVSTIDSDLFGLLTRQCDAHILKCLLSQTPAVADSHVTILMEKMSVFLVELQSCQKRLHRLVITVCLAFHNYTGFSVSNGSFTTLNCFLLLRVHMARIWKVTKRSSPDYFNKLSSCVAQRVW